MRAAILTDQPDSKSSSRYTVQVKDYSLPEALPDQAVVQIQAAALNHRDLWIVKDQYRGIKTNSILGSDAVGQVVAGDSGATQVGERVLISPMVNWESDPRAPEGEFNILGLLPSIGTLVETINVDRKEIFPCPEHLSTAEAAALPLAGLTAYRALFTKAQVRKGDHVLITGIGGGVALFALQFAVAIGANVYVTSSSAEKIDQAIKLGAKGGINYKDEGALTELEKLLNGAKISAVIDGAGGKLLTEYVRVMRQGGIIVHYGQTAGATSGFDVSLVIDQIEFKGTTMGSRAEFKQMLEFVEKYKIHPIVSDVFHGLTQQNVDDALDLLEQGSQFGKVVIEIQNTRQKL